MTKNEIVGTCPKSKLSIEGTNDPLGVKYSPRHKIINNGLLGYF